MSFLVLSLQLNCSCWIFFVLNSLDMESWRGLESLVGYFYLGVFFGGKGSGEPRQAACGVLVP